jgi:hypothetical protein
MKDSPPSPLVSNRMQDSMSRSGVGPRDQSVLADNRREIAASTREPIRERAEDPQARYESRDRGETAPPSGAVSALMETKEDLQDRVSQLTECNRRQQEMIAYLRQRLRAPENGPDGSQAAADRAHRAVDIPLRQDPAPRAEMERRPGHGRSPAVGPDDDIPF